MFTCRAARVCEPAARLEMVKRRFQLEPRAAHELRLNRSNVDLNRK